MSVLSWARRSQKWTLPHMNSEKALPRPSLHTVSSVSSWARDKGKGPGIIRKVLGSDCSFHLLGAHPLPWGGGHQEILALEESGGGAGQRGCSQDPGALPPALTPPLPSSPALWASPRNGPGNSSPLPQMGGGRGVLVCLWNMCVCVSVERVSVKCDCVSVKCDCVCEV